MNYDTPPNSPESSYASKHALTEPTLPLLLTPRSNLIPRPRQPIDSPPPDGSMPDLTRPSSYIGRHRIESPGFKQWLGGRTAHVAAVVMFGAGISMYGVGSSMEATVERETASIAAFDELTRTIERNASDHTSRGNNRPTPSARPTPIHTKSKAQAPPAKPAQRPDAQRKPAPGTDCDYMPKHQHKASETSAAKAMAIGKEMIVACFGTKQWPYAKDLWRRESNWRPMATNPKSGACGIVQSWPCGKLLRASGDRSLGNTTVEEQMRWGIDYVKERYGTPEKARRHWLARVPVKGRDMGHWY